MKIEYIALGLFITVMVVMLIFLLVSGGKKRGGEDKKNNTEKAKELIKIYNETKKQFESTLKEFSVLGATPDQGVLYCTPATDTDPYKTAKANFEKVKADLVGTTSQEIQKFPDTVDRSTYEEFLKVLDENTKLWNLDLYKPCTELCGSGATLGTSPNSKVVTCQCTRGYTLPIGFKPELGKKVTCDVTAHTIKTQEYVDNYNKSSQAYKDSLNSLNFMDSPGCIDWYKNNPTARPGSC